jgi:hypothetical protein
MPYIIGALIIAYAGYVIYKKIKDIKAGKFCSCGCGDCPSKAKCSGTDTYQNSDKVKNSITSSTK